MGPARGGPETALQTSDGARRRWLSSYVDQLLLRDAALEDARHLAWLRDQLGPQFVAGVLFHTGPRRFRLGERIVALPISSLWG